MAAPIGFEGVTEPKGEKEFGVATPMAEGTGGATGYRTFDDEAAPVKDSGSEEIKLLQRSGTPDDSGGKSEAKVRAGEGGLELLGAVPPACSARCVGERAATCLFKLCPLPAS